MSDNNHFDSNLTEYTVSQISSALKRTVENAFERVRIHGEISGLKRAASGHVYLTLKDDKAVLDGVIWRGTASSLSFVPEDGLDIVAEGRITTYAARSRYQLVIDRLEPAGVGALLALLEERRKKLSNEGLFDKERKVTLPYLPSRIGIITSPTGAVVRDILRRLRDRFPRNVVIWPVLVQGKGAGEQVAAAIAGFNKLEVRGQVLRPDLLIVARGGGSVEDLWAFNEEVVVRAVAQSKIPIISAVGHETDNTLIDLVADRRAPTPTAAAEMAVPVRADLIINIAELDRQMIFAISRNIIELRRTIEGLARGLPRPERLIGDAIQRLDERDETIQRVFSAYFDRRKASLEANALKLPHPRERLVGAEKNLIFAAKRLVNSTDTIIKECVQNWRRCTEYNRCERAIERIFEDASGKVNTIAMLLESYSYQRVIERGFTVIRDEHDKLVARSSQIADGANATVEFADEIRDIRVSKPVRKKKQSRDRLAKNKNTQGGEQEELL